MSDGQLFQIANGSLTFRQLGNLLSEIWNNAYPDIPMYASGTSTDDVIYPNVTWSCAGKWVLNALKPRLIDEFVSDEGDGIAKSMIKFRALLQIKIQARDSETANQLIETFELFMFEFVGAVKKAGIAEVIYGERKPDEIAPAQKSNVVVRTLVYEVHEQLSFVAKQPLIEMIVTRVKAVFESHDESTEEIVSTIT